MSIRLLKKDETFSPTIDIIGRVATAHYAVRQNENSGDRYVISTKFDFTGVMEDELIEMATKGLVIDSARRWRVKVATTETRPAALKGEGFATCNVREVLDAPRTRTAAPPVAKAKKLLDDMSPEQLAEVLAHYEALKAKKAA